MVFKSWEKREEGVCITFSRNLPIWGENKGVSFLLFFYVPSPLPLQPFFSVNYAPVYSIALIKLITSVYTRKITMVLMCLITIYTIYINIYLFLWSDLWRYLLLNYLLHRDETKTMKEHDHILLVLKVSYLSGFTSNRSICPKYFVLMRYEL